MKHNPINLLLIILLALGLGACSKTLETTDESQLEKNEKSIQDYLTKNNLSAIRDSSGLYFIKTVTNPQGAKAKVGDEVAVFYRTFRLDGTLLASTDTTRKEPLRFPFGANYHLPGVERGISLMRAGEKITLLLPFYLAYGNVNYDQLPAYSPVRVELELLQARSEAQQITDYVRDKNYTVSETTPSGVKIIRQNIVVGDTLGKGKSISVKYAGRTLQDKEFDKGTLDFTTGGFIKGTNFRTVVGFDEGIRRMRKGEKAVLIFPSSLGYGTKGAGKDILPYAPLAFEIEVLD